MKLLRSTLISLFLMVMLGSGVMAQNLYSQYYDFSTNSWKGIPTTNVEVENVKVTSIQENEQTYTGYNITLPEGNGQDYYYLLEPSQTATGLILTSPYADTEKEEEGKAEVPKDFNLGKIYIVVPQGSSLDLDYEDREGHGFGVYVESVLQDNNQNLPIDLNFVPGGNNQSGTLSPDNAGTINIEDDLTPLISDLNLGKDLASLLANDTIILNINSGINFNIINEGSEEPSTSDTANDPNALGLPITINNYANLSLQNVELLNLKSINNGSTGTLSLNSNCILQIVDGRNLTNSGNININEAGILNIGKDTNTASLENSNTIFVLDGGTLNCYGTLANNDDAQLNIEADADVTMYANSMLDNNGTITVTPPAS